MASMLPFVINNLLSGMINGQGNNSGGIYNNNIMDILSGIMGNQVNNNGTTNTNSQVSDNIFNILSGMDSNNMRRETKQSRHKKNIKKQEHKNNSFNNDFTNSFNTIFNQTFSALVNNQGIIENIVDTVLNSELIGGMIEEIERLDEMTMDLKEYSDKYIIEGRLPGVSKKDIDIDYNENIITIKVNNNKIFTNRKNSMVAIIQPNSYIEKNFIVNDIDVNQISAVFKSDLLMVCIFKKVKPLDTNTIIDVDNYILE